MTHTLGLVLDKPGLLVLMVPKIVGVLLMTHRAAPGCRT